MTFIEGTLIKRYKRFFADVELASGKVITAYCCNTGKLLGMPKNPLVLLKEVDPNSTRKLKYTFECFKDGPTWVGINTQKANHFAYELLTQKLIPGLENYDNICLEVKYGQNSRVDFLLKNNQGALFYLEIKSVHMKRGETAVFPDCPTVRGAKHMRELALTMCNNTKAGVLYVIQRDDCKAMSIAPDLDPTYAKAAFDAKMCGVQMMAVALTMDHEAKATFKEILPYQEV